MGVVPTLTYDGNLMISPGFGTVDLEGNLMEDRMRLAVRCLFGTIKIISKYAGAQ
jgi:hypothetical protein